MARAENPAQVEAARARAEAEAPFVWMLGAPGSGQTAVMAALAQEWRAALRQELRPATATAESFAHPAEMPLIRFLLTTAIHTDKPYDEEADMALVAQAPGLVLVTQAADAPVSPGLVATLRRVRRAHPDWPVLVAQTRLHLLYPPGQGHALPYAFDSEGIPLPRAPHGLAGPLAEQRAAFGELADGFVPLDLTEGATALDPPDYGLEALRTAMIRLAPSLAPGLAPQPDPEERIWQRVILPWAAAAAATDAPPLPILGGLPAIALQGAMVRAIARRFEVADDATVWAGLISALGTGFVLRYALGWMLRQVLKLAPFWGGAAAAAWTFAVTCGIGEAAIRLCKAEAEGRRPTREALRAAFSAGSRRGGVLHGAGRGGAPR